MKAKHLLAFICVITFSSCNNTKQGTNEIEVEDTIIIDEPESLSNIDYGMNEDVGSTDEWNVFPTQSEIEEVNAKLPVLVSEGTLNTKVEYDERTKVQTFYYRFTQEVDESLITKEIVQQLKSSMVAELKKNANNVKRIKSGMSFHYIYFSVDDRRLYEIKINANDL